MVNEITLSMYRGRQEASNVLEEATSYTIKAEEFQV